MDTDSFKTLITLRKAEITALIQRVSDSAEANLPVVELDQTRVGRLSRMDALQIHQMDQETTRRRQRELIALDAALSRIDNGEFGFCIECDEQINPKRLEINPGVMRCIKCAELNELR